MAQALEKMFLQKVAQMPQEEAELLPPAPKGKGRKPAAGTQSAGKGAGGCCHLVLTPPASWGPVAPPSSASLPVKSGQRHGELPEPGLSVGRGPQAIWTWPLLGALGDIVTGCREPAQEGIVVLPCPRVPPPGSALRPPLLEAQAGARAVPLSPLGLYLLSVHCSLCGRRGALSPLGSVVRIKTGTGALRP